MLIYLDPNSIRELTYFWHVRYLQIEVGGVTPTNLVQLIRRWIEIGVTSITPTSDHGSRLNESRVSYTNYWYQTPHWTERYRTALMC